MNRMALEVGVVKLHVAAGPFGGYQTLERLYQKTKVRRGEKSGAFHKMCRSASCRENVFDNSSQYIMYGLDRMHT